MPNILNAIDDQYEYMTTTEQYIAQFILNHPYDIINMSVESLSKTLNIDVTKIDAFSYQFNDDGFEGLKINIQQIFPKQSLPYNIEILANDSVDKIKINCINVLQMLLIKVPKQLNLMRLIKCKQLKRAKTIYVWLRCILRMCTRYLSKIFTHRIKRASRTRNAYVNDTIVYT